MRYLPSVLLLAVGLLLLGVLLYRVLRALRRFATYRAVAGSQVSDGTGMLRARVAAVKIAIAERWRADGTPAPRSMRRGRQEAHGGG